ncbi:hypothetical protein [Shewanella mangrovisoli]|uniref:hypothetical protein n=1 Tax=Shewanella mangrovisoli TaxID=2864211 RepID=UPI001C65769B|nr:hypothetical protein [Shewanella mangrovisoli]QYK08537.1 hypothetical protein K0H60_17265 [Shewanella mangrovisoli]
MRLFCEYSSICFDILDDDCLLMSCSSGEYFIHYVGDYKERFDSDLCTKKGFFKGTDLEVLEQLKKQGRIPQEKPEIYLDLETNVSLMATLKVQLLGESFINALYAYAESIEDKVFSKLVISKAEDILKKTKLEYTAVDSSIDFRRIQRKVF